ISEPITASLDDGVITLTRPDDHPDHRSLHGLTRSLISNLIEGVFKGFTKTLEIQGVGYRVQARGSNLEFSLGYSHPVVVEPPEGITFRVESPRSEEHTSELQSRF